MNKSRLKECIRMYQDHYFLEKSMEQHNRSIEQETRKWWNFGSKKEPAAPAPESISVSACCGKDKGVCCEAYIPCQA
jgi:hypothetical protein